ncbi:hypothetical protein GCM10010280_16670 [Streptomyces pilosus]|uniref:Tn3 transposase DDE domain-containing protein n=1 Tax=Streptomyces pilosus TaxID=28893 RepID=A0A918EUP6_9ACTN|nr:transposase [Streptomyces pilosus]GGQ70754.1 hypothetical protein GCM10010280_16670 [Streptomyces pilosus]
MVESGTSRDFLHVLDALLNLDGGVKPEMLATDNASHSDMVFGRLRILGYNFSLRFRDLDDQRFLRAAVPGVETGTYGTVEDRARNRVPHRLPRPASDVPAEDGLPPCARGSGRS